MAPSPLDQVIGSGTGTRTSFQLVKRYESGGEVHVRTIAKPVAGSVRLALGGIEQMSGWTLDATTGVVTFAVAPASGVAVTAGFLFDVPVRFRDDKLAVTAESFAAGEAPDIGLIEIRI